MRIRLKKHHEGRVMRTEGSGDIKDIVINQDFMEPAKVSVSLLFRGHESSGIIDLTPEEIEMLNKEMSSKKSLIKGVKVLKFKK